MRIFLLALLFICFSNFSFSQGTNCQNASPFCTGTSYAFQNNTNVSSVAGPDYGCLTTQPNQAWYYLKIGTAGNIQIGINQTTGTGGTGSGIDVDFICWGPFTSPTAGCNNLTSGNIVDCSYSSSSTETCTINSAAVGQYYVLLLTNYSNTSGYIQFSQVGGTGATDCSILCPLGNGGITSAGALTCTNSPVAIYADESALPVGQTITPCLQFEVPLTDNSGKNILEVYEGSTLLGCFRPAASSSTCSPNVGTIPNNNKWDVYVSFLDPTQPHTFKICEDNSASTSGNMSYKIFDCYSTTGVPIASGTWTVNSGTAYPSSCQSIVINPGTGAGQWNFTGTSFFSGPGISTTNWGAAVFNPATAGPGTHVVTYNWNNGQAGAALCAGTKTMAVTVSNPFNASFTAPGPLCSNAACTTLTPTNTYTVGTNSWSGTGVSGNTFCPSSSGTGSFPVTYSVGTSATCNATQTNTIVVNAVPVANAGSPAALTCSNTNTILSGSGGTTYSWTGPAGGISSGANTATPTVSLAGTYTLQVNNGTCSNTATVAVTQNTTAPIPTASNSTTLNCSTNTVALTGGPASGVTYQWSGPGFSGGTTSQNAVGTAAGTYTLKVTSTVNSCTAIATTAVTQNTTAPSPTASSPSSITCSTNTVNLTGGPAAGVTYSWTGPGFSGGTNSQNAVATSPGTYTLTVTSTVNSCTAAATTAVAQNTTAPSPTASSPSSITCSTNTVNLTGGPASGVTYSWTGPGFSGGTTSQNAIATSPGTYTLTVTNSVNSCTAAATTSVGQNTIAPTVTLPSTQTITCASPSVSLIGSANPSTCTPVWTGGVCAGATSYTASACSPNTYTLTITNPLNGCTASGTVAAVASVGVPSVTASNTGSITCTNTTAQVVASTTMTPVSYAWTGPGAVTGASTSTGTVSVGGSYQCIVTNTLTGCASTITTIVPTNTTPVTASVAPTSSITCATTSLTLNASPTGAYSYSWAPNAGLTGNSVATPTVNQGGVYTVTITNTVNGCSGNTNITVPTNTTSPTVSLAVNSITTTCSSPTATLNASSNPSAGATYSWTAPSTGSLNSNTISNPIASGSGVFTVVVTNAINGCSNATSQATLEIIPDAAVPSVSVSANSLTITCTNTTVTTALTSTSSISSYSWNPSPVSGGANPVFNTTGTYNATVTASNGCATNVSVDVTVDNSEPVITLSSAVNDGTITCTNTSVLVTPSVTPSSNLTYTWSPSTGISTPVNQSSATFTAGGIYTLAVTNTLTGCVSSSTTSANTFTIYVNNATPTITAAQTSTNSVIGCANPVVSYSANVTSTGSSLTYTWNPGGVNTQTIDINTAGVYDVTVMDAVSGCTAATQFTVDGSTTIPTADAGTSASIACGSSSVALSGTSTSTNVSYSWTGPSSSSIISGSNTATPTVADTGAYVLTIVDNLTGCQNTATVIVSQANVTASFTANPTSGLSPLTVNFTDQSIGANTWNWNFGDSNSANFQNPTNTFNTGTYTVTLTASTGSCVSTATLLIVVEDGLTLEIPNVFTPNDDNTNDVFTIKSTGVKEITLQIFNRWGQKLLEFSGPKASWDGLTPSGTKAPEGTYFYFVIATGFDDKEIKQNGTVNLFR